MLPPWRLPGAFSDGLENVPLLKPVAAPKDDEKDAARWAAARPVLRPTILFALAAAILGWWICSTILKDTRHRWIVQTFWAWFFIM